MLKYVVHVYVGRGGGVPETIWRRDDSTSRIIQNNIQHARCSRFTVSVSGYWGEGGHVKDMQTMFILVRYGKIQHSSNE